MVPITGTLPSKDLRAAEAQTTAMHTVAALKKMDGQKLYLFWEDAT